MSGQLSAAPKCPNCTDPVKGHIADVCLLSALAGILQDRGVEDEEIERIVAKTDTGALWEDLGKIVDKLEDGEYDNGD